MTGHEVYIQVLKSDLDRLTVSRNWWINIAEHFSAQLADTQKAQKIVFGEPVTSTPVSSSLFVDKLHWLEVIVGEPHMPRLLRAYASDDSSRGHYEIRQDDVANWFRWFRVNPYNPIIKEWTTDERFYIEDAAKATVAEYHRLRKEGVVS